MKYDPVTAEVAAELARICGGEKYVIFRDEERLEPFSHDEIPGTRYRAMPEVVVRPDSAEQISDIVKLANRLQIPVTPRGAGSGLSGGAVPVYGGIVIATDRLNRIVEFDRPNMMITVEPGVISNDINEYLKDSGLFYAGYPMSMESCFIGGNVAENAGGGKTVKYGVTSRYVLGLEVVTPTGEIVQLGGKLQKDVTGYNLIQLMAGSEGTLGIFTKIILKLIPRPACQVDLLCLFRTGAEAVAAVPEIMIGSGITPTSMEYMDSLAFRRACEYINETLPIADCGAMLLITVDGSDRDQVEREYIKVGEFAEKHGATCVYVADNRATSERIWKIRRNIAESFSVLTKLQSGEDIVVPPGAIAHVVAEFNQLAEEFGVMIPCYGHAGDGNVHARVCADPAWSEEEFNAKLPAILDRLYRVTASHGGRISGEHGIGCKRRAYMDRVVSPEYIDLLKKIKKSLDPGCIMNPGKIF